jgi:hypothetical protein
MAATLDAARALKAEGDRLLACAARHACASTVGVSGADLDLASQCYAQAADAYVEGAAQYQQSEASVTDVRASADAQGTSPQLQGRLRAEAGAALRDASRRLGARTAHPSLEHSRAFAEGHRERLVRAAPELFDGADHAAQGWALEAGPSR